MQHQAAATVLPRLTAFWAFCEAGLGGFLHAFRLPFTGILVSGMSVVGLLMIGRYAPKREKAILPAWAAVSAVKFALSPYSPPTAYLAMSFQALFTAFCLRCIPSFRMAAILAAVVSLVESAAQRILVLTVFFGMALWDSINRVQLKIFKDFFPESAFNNSQWLIGVYLLMHALAGLWLGIFAGGLPAWIDKQETPLIAVPAAAVASSAVRPKKRLKNYVVALILGAWGLFLIATNRPGGWRMVSGGLAWLFFMTGFVQNYLRAAMGMAIQRMRQPSFEKADQVMAALPEIQYAVTYAWEKARYGRSGWLSIPLLIKTVLLVVVKVPGTGIEPARP